MRKQVLEKTLKSNFQAMVADVGLERRIFVKNFPRETTVNDLKTFFETYGTVEHVNFVNDHKSGLAKYGFATFESKDVQEKVCQEKNVVFQGKTLCIGKARRKGPPEKNSENAAHGYRRCFPSRQTSVDYSYSTAPMGYYVHWPYQNPFYVSAVQAPTVAQISSPTYQTSYIPSNHQFFPTLMPGSPTTSAFVHHSLNSGEQFLLPVPRTNYVDAYPDYQTISSISTLPTAPRNDWPSMSANSENGMSIFAKETLPMSPKTKGKPKSMQSSGVKEDEDASNGANESSHVPVAAVLPTTKEIHSP